MLRLSERYNEVWSFCKCEFIHYTPQQCIRQKEQILETWIGLTWNGGVLSLRDSFLESEIFGFQTEDCFLSEEAQH